MNLQAIANSCIQIVNPDKTVTWKRSNGYTVAENGKQIPSYEVYETKAQIQSASGDSLRQVAELNMTGVSRTVYMPENIMSVSFRAERGGDFLEFSEFEGHPVTLWKVVGVRETWDNWACVTVVQQ